MPKRVLFLINQVLEEFNEFCFVYISYQLIGNGSY